MEVSAKVNSIMLPLSFQCIELRRDINELDNFSYSHLNDSVIRIDIPKPSLRCCYPCCSLIGYRHLPSPARRGCALVDGAPQQAAALPRDPGVSCQHPGPLPRSHQGKTIPKVLEIGSARTESFFMFDQRRANRAFILALFNMICSLALPKL